MGGKTVPETGVALTYDEIESFTNLSRSMVSQGLKLLVHYQLIVVTPIGRARSYSLRDYALPDGWAKIPQDRIFTPPRGLFAFKGASHRSRHEFNTLKLYLVLLSFKPNTANYAQIGYEKISEYTGIARTDIRKAVSNLIEYGLVTVSSGESWTTGAAPPNRYVIAGL